MNLTVLLRRDEAREGPNQVLILLNREGQIEEGVEPRRGLVAAAKNNHQPESP